MYTAKERKTLVIETAHFFRLGCFYVHGILQKAPWTGSEKYGFRCRRLQEQVSQNGLMQTGWP